jgi:hypothetical protein
MRLTAFAKLVLFSLVIYATVGTYQWMVLNQVAPKPVHSAITWTPSDQKAVSVAHDGDEYLAAAIAFSAGYSTGEDRLLAPKPKNTPFPTSVMIAWGVLLN